MRVFKPTNFLYYIRVIKLNLVDQMKSSLLIGCVGNPNFGDETIMRVWIDKYKNSASSNIIICDGINNSNLRKYIDILGYKNINVIPNDLSLFSLGKYISYSDSGIRINNKKDFFSKISAISKYLEDCGVNNIHMFGGGYINSMWRHHLPIIVGSKLISDNINSTLFSTGQGLIPWDKKLDPYLNVLMDFDKIDVRDISSLNVLPNHSGRQNVSFSGDDAILLFSNPQNFAIKEEKVPSLVMCLQNDLFQGSDLFSKILTEKNLAAIKSCGISNVKIISAMQNDVKKLNERQAEIIKNTGFSISYVDSDELLKNGIPFHKESFFLTSRYHIHLIAAFSGGKGFAFYQNKYYENKHFSVKTMGSLWPVFDVKDFNFNDFGNLIANQIKNQTPFDEMVFKFWHDKKKKLAEEIFTQQFQKKYFSENIKSLLEFLV